MLSDNEGYANKGSSYRITCQTTVSSNSVSSLEWFKDASSYDCSADANCNEIVTTATGTTNTYVHGSCHS